MKLEVSLGEALDKLSILEIKLFHIKDTTKQQHIQFEISQILPELESFTSTYLYHCLKQMNLIIWDLCEDLRFIDLESSTYAKKCVDIIKFNDSRFKIKNKINLSQNSSIKEVKSYPKNQALFHLSNNLHQLSILNSAIRYYSHIYDKLYLVCPDTIIEHCNHIFSDDSTIQCILHTDDLKMETIDILYKNDIETNNPIEFYNHINLDYNVIKNFYHEHQ